MLQGDPEVTAFRAESEIQDHFRGRDDGSFRCAYERIYFDTEAGPLLQRLSKTIATRYREREPRILPFSERLQGFDMIQSWELFTDWTAQAVAARERYGIPLSLMVWDNIPFNMERNRQRRRLKEHAANAADNFIVHTQRSRRMLDIEGVPAEKVVQIPPGVDTDLFCPGERNRKSFGLKDDEFVILFVGWLLPRKGIDFLLLALRELAKDPALSGHTFRLALVGSGPGKDRVQELIQRANIEAHCTFLGPLSYGEMPQVFRAADAFVLPSIATPEWQEQFGMSLIEAMACGIPVISTYSGAIPEMTADAAMLCQPNDFVSLYDALKDLALNPSKREDLAAAGRQRALDHFKLSDFAAALSEIYASLLKG